MSLAAGTEDRTRAGGAPTTPTTRLGKVLAELSAAHASGQTTVLSGSAVNDVFVADLSADLDGQPTLARLPEALAAWSARQRRRTLLYSYGPGLIALTPDHRHAATAMPAELLPAARRGGQVDVAADVSAILDGLSQPGQMPTLLLVDWAELAIPNDPTDPSGRPLLEHLATVGIDPAWAGAGHQLVLLDHSGGIDARLTASIGVHVHFLGRPSEHERVQAAQLLAAGTRRHLHLGPGLDADQFGRLTGGQMLDALVRARDSSTAQDPITAARIVASKAGEIRHQAGDVVRVLSDPDRRFDGSVAGLPQVRLLVEESTLVGQSIRAILVGPPGVGKSYAAVAIANQLGVPCVSLGLVRNMYVGESERQLEQAIDLIRAYAPVVVFLDEADQGALGSRKTAVDSSDVNRTMRGRLFEAFGDNGDDQGISVVLASNAVFGLDDATLSRFEPIPVLYPTAFELANILLIDAHRHHIPTDDGSIRAAVQSYAEQPLAMSGRDIVRIRQDATLRARWAGRADITGADVARAMDDSLHHPTPDAEIQILHSLLATRTMRRLPWVAAAYYDEPTEPPAYLKEVLDANGAPNPERIAARLRDLDAGVP